MHVNEEITSPRQMRLKAKYRSAHRGRFHGGESSVVQILARKK